MRNSLNRTRSKLCLICLFFLLSVISLNINLFCDDYSTFWGQIVNPDNQPLSGVSILISNKEQNLKTNSVSDQGGSFEIVGIPPGHYTASIEAQGFHPLIQEDIFLEPSQTLYIKIILSPKEKNELSSSKLLLLDYSNCMHQTILDKSQIHESPSGHNVWFLVENQDLSATTNRIDVGGLWGSIPALFSSRGGSSWTQNIYLLNGMDVTDPYWSGRPLFYPDFYMLHYTQLINAGHPAQALFPGGYFNLMSREGSDRFQGSISAFFINKTLQSTNISPALEKEGIFESHSFNSLVDGNLHLSGPIVPGKLSFFTSLSSFHISRDLADYDHSDKTSVYSGYLNLKYRHSENTLRFIWTGQIVSHPSFGAERDIPLSSTTDRRDIYNVYQFIWNSRIRDNHFLKAGICFVLGDSRADFQSVTNSPHGLEIFRNIPTGNAAFAHKDSRSALSFLIKGDSVYANFLNASHKLQYGFQWQRSYSSSQKEIVDNLHLHFFRAEPLEIIKYNTPLRHKESSYHLNLFIQDTVTLSNFVSFYLGFNLASSKAWAPNRVSNQGVLNDFALNSEKKEDIRWLNISPRLGLILPLSKSKTSAIKISAARYFFTLPLHYLTYGNPNALGGLVYAWNDINEDRQFQESEEGELLRREGPLFSKIDSDLKRPYTDELAVTYTFTFGSSWYFSLAGFYRANRNLVETSNIGVPLSSYEQIQIYDKGDDRILNTHDDLNFIVYNQNKETFGQDFFLLTNADSENRISKYYGLDLTLVKKFSERFTFFFTLTATSAAGTTNPGNTEWENDDGVIGSLYDNPNNFINAEGRVRFDRAYTGRVGFNYLAPFDIRIGCIIKYYDGQPFARKIIVEGLNQGPFYIQAHPRGVARYEYNRTVEIRIEKTFHFGGTKLRIIVDGFNIINRGLATEENEWTGPEFPLRYATEIQSPRVFRLGLAYDF